MPVETRLYDVLGVPPDASEADIKKAFRRQSLANHPDKNPGDESASARFQEISAAYETLSDPDERAAYDRYGEGGGPQGIHVDMDDILASMFAGPPRRPRRAQDAIIPYAISLEDLFRGRTTAFALERNVPCAACGGSGARAYAKPRDCVTCGGSGRVLQQRQAGSGMISQSIAPCSDCGGEGKKLREQDRCRRCKGARTTTTKTRLRVNIPRGAYDGQRIIFPGQGDQLPGSDAAAVIFELQQKPHPALRVHNLDLATDVRITLSEALYGFSRTVLTHLDGRNLRVTKARGDIVRPGQVDIVPGEGMMDQRYQEVRGDLYLCWQIEFPADEWALKGGELPPGLPDIGGDDAENINTVSGTLDTLGSKIGTRTDDRQSAEEAADDDIQCAQQ